MKDLKDLSSDLAPDRHMIFHFQGHKSVECYVSEFDAEGKRVEFRNCSPASRAKPVTYVLDTIIGRMTLGDGCVSGYNVLGYDIPSGLPKRQSNNYVPGGVGNENIGRMSVTVSRWRGRIGQMD